MKKFILLLLLFPQLIFAQSEDSDYELYNQALARWNKLGISSKVDSIVLIKKLHKKLVNWDIEFHDFGVDSYRHPDFDYLYLKAGKNMALIDRLIEDSSLIASLQSLTKKLEPYPKIRSKLFLNEKLRVKPISWWRYYSFHFPRFRRPTIWKKIKRKFGARYVVMFSEIEYSEKYAVFYYAYYCGRLCGSGDLLVFEKVGNQWISLGKLNFWMS